MILASLFVQLMKSSIFLRLLLLEHKVAQQQPWQLEIVVWISNNIKPIIINIELHYTNALICFPGILNYFLRKNGL